MSVGTARTVYTARWVLPISSAPIADGAVVTEGDRIAWVGLEASLPAGLAAARRVDLGNAALLPGLVNAHTHLELTAMRGFLEGLAFRNWLVVLTKARRECFDTRSMYDASCAGIEEALRNGITTMADTTESGAPLSAMRDLGVRGVGYIEVFGPDVAQCDASMEGLIKAAELQRANDTALVRTGLSPHAPYTVSPPLYRAVAEFARAGQWPVAVHIAESTAESAFVRDGTGPFAEGHRARGIAVTPHACSPIALIDECGVLDTRPLLIHAIQLDAADIARIARSGATVVHCPISNLKLGHGIAPIAALRAAGVAVGLGTDSVASNDRVDLLGEARLAALLYAAQAGTPDALSAHDALAMATIGGARALAMDDEIGTLDVGKAADLTAFALSAPDAQPVHDPAVTLVHALAGAAPAVLTVVAGRELLRDGALTHRDAERQSRIEALGERLRTWRAKYTTDLVERSM